MDSKDKALCLDEAIEPYKGRDRNMSCTIPNKPHKWGIRLYYTFSKHMCLFSIYLKNGNLPNKDENAPNMEN